MMNLIPHHRIQIPNGLAMFAALLLLISSVTGFKTSQEGYSSGQETTTSIKAGSGIDDSAENKSRGLKLGLLLFRRG
jgi:hypothetical protein